MTVRVENPQGLKTVLTRRRLVLYGMGTIGMEISRWLDQQGIRYIFADKDAQEKQRAVGKPVISPQVVTSQYQDANIVIATNIYFDEIKALLLEHGFSEEQIISYAVFIPSNTVWADLEDSIDWSLMRPSVELFSQWLDADDRSVADYGAGQMYLKTFLPQDAAYFPVDYLQRFAETIVCDLNTGSFPDLDVDVSVLNGVLEFLVTAEALLLHACRKSGKKVILSYMTKDRFPNQDARRASGYVSDLTEKRILHIMNTCGFRLAKREPDPLDATDTIYLFVREC